MFQEAIRYAQRDTYEQRILDYIKNEFKFSKTSQQLKKEEALAKVS